MTKITFIISNVNNAIEHEWIAKSILSEYKIDFLILNPFPGKLAENLKNIGVEVKNIRFRGKKDYPIAFLKVFFHLITNRPQIIHSHLIDASLIGIIAGYILNIKHRIYTRHHSSFHHIYFPKAVKYDKLCNTLATKIVAVSELVKNILMEWEKVKSNKIFVIEHGLDKEYFIRPSDTDVNSIKNKYSLNDRYPVIGVVSRYTHWKGIQNIIPAFIQIKNKYPNAILILANAGKGDYSKKIEVLLNSLHVNDYTEIEFEENIKALYLCFDVFVHVPIDYHSEAFGQIYIEAMALGVSMVATRSGIGNTLLKHKRNSYIAEYEDSESILEGVDWFLNGNKAYVKKQAYKDASSYTLARKICLLYNLYNNG